MAKSQKLEALQEMLKQARANPDLEEAIAQTRTILQSKHAAIVAQTAKLVRERAWTVLFPELVAAFERFLVKPVETDPNCLAKVAIANALYTLDYRDADVFLKGIHHVQKEPVWGTTVDTAPKLRATCALGLVRMNYPGVWVKLADLLADPEVEARVGAAQAIAYTEDEQRGVPLLRLRARVGDVPPVLSECLTGLLKLAPQNSVDFVAQFLQAPDLETQELTALALGESRLMQAFERLVLWWRKTTDPELRRSGLLAIALLRQEPAIEFLLTLAAEGKPEDAKGAIAAFAPYKYDEALQERLKQALGQRKDGQWSVG